MNMLTEEELQDRISNRPKKYWLKCDKCDSMKADRQLCKCGRCSNDKPRMFVHLNEPNPHTVDWKSFDRELNAYTRHGCYDTWSLCNGCSKKLQMYADWDQPHPEVIKI